MSQLHDYFCYSDAYIMLPITWNDNIIILAYGYAILLFDYNYSYAYTETELSKQKLWKQLHHERIRLEKGIILNFLNVNYNMQQLFCNVIHNNSRPYRQKLIQQRNLGIVITGRCCCTIVNITFYINLVSTIIQSL